VSSVQIQWTEWSWHIWNYVATKLRLRDKKSGDINEWPTKNLIRMWPKCLIKSIVMNYYSKIFLKIKMCELLIYFKSY